MKEDEIKNLIQICKESYSYSEVLKKINKNLSGNSYNWIKKVINQYNIDISHFKGKAWRSLKIKKDIIKKENRKKYKFNDIFKKNSTVTQKVLREYVKFYNLLEYRCINCGCDGNWQNGIISLELDHIDGNNKNNEPNNLRYLCPNCHALTETYRGKNKKIKNKK